MENIKRAILTYIKLRKLGVSLHEIRRLIHSEDIRSTILFKKKLSINSSFWYLHGLNEIFIEKIYQFKSGKQHPVILDCGANIGLSVIYFKSIYPNARIIAFEPDKDICNILRDNLSSFNIKNVELKNKAVWNENGNINFIASGGVGGRIGSRSHDDAVTQVQCARLKDFLKEKVDFLKLDIEGAEYEVLKDCSQNLTNVENIFVEYHSLPSREQKLDEILLILKNAGFKYYIKEAWVNQAHPYVNERKNLYDLQLNIFGYRTERL